MGPLRILLAAHPQLLSAVLQIVHRVIATFLIKQAGLKRCEAHTGAVTLIQRFGSAANLNIHLDLLAKVIARLMRLLTRQGVLVEEQGVRYLAGIEADQALMPLQAGSCTYRIALGPRAGQKVVEPASGLGTWRIRLASLVRQCARLQPACGGAARDAHERNDLERLCRYITRPAIANERLRRNIAAARDELRGRGVEVSEVFHSDGVSAGTDEPYLFGRRRISGPDPERGSYRSIASFRDPDGNGWLFQEVTTRLPGRIDSGVTSFASANDLADAFRRAEAAHGKYEAKLGKRDENWPDWYAAYMVEEQSGAKLPE